VLTAGFVFLAANGAYLLLFVGPDLLYVANVLLHFGVGLLVILPFAFWAVRRFRADAAEFPRRGVARVGIAVMTAGIAAGIALALVGGLRAHRWLLDAHMTLAAVGAVLLAYGVVRHAGQHHQARGSRAGWRGVLSSRCPSC